MTSFQEFIKEVAAANGKKPNCNEISLMYWAFNAGQMAQYTECNCAEKSRVYANITSGKLEHEWKP